MMIAATDHQDHCFETAWARGLDVSQIRQDFPILCQQIRGHPIVYLDNAATSQKPQMVIDAINRYYRTECANIHRGAYLLGEQATQEYEDARVKVQEFIHAAHAHEIIFVRGATEGINLIAQTYGRQHVGPGDEILISAMEHHANIVPWQILCQEKGAHLKVIPINDRGELELQAYERLLNPQTRLVAVAQASNVLGTINPMKQMIDMAHGHNVPIVIDGAQAAPHLPVDVQQLDCDFYTFSGHKMYGPTGIGILYGKSRYLDAMPPYQGGGGMIRSVRFEESTYNELPGKFEAGTPHIAGAIGLAAAIDYINSIGLETMAAHERDLIAYALESVANISGLRLIGSPRNRVAILSFVLEGTHPHDIGTILDTQGIVVRAGHHCAQPVMDRLGIPATTRASFAFYNTRQEIDALVEGLGRVKEVFQ